MENIFYIFAYKQYNKMNSILLYQMEGSHKGYPYKLYIIPKPINP